MSQFDDLYEKVDQVGKELDAQAEMLEKICDRLSVMEELVLNASIAKVDDQGRLTTKTKRGSPRASSPLMTPHPESPEDPRTKAPGRRPS